MCIAFKSVNSELCSEVELLAKSESFDGGAIICDAADVIFLGGMKLNYAVPCFLK